MTDDSANATRTRADERRGEGSTYGADGASGERGLVPAQSPERAGWHQFRTGPARTGYAPGASAPVHRTRLRWTAPIGADVRSPPVVAADTVFAATERGLAALDAADGRTRWTHHTGVPLSPAAVESGRLYAGGRDGRLHALTLVGDEQWAVEAGRGMEATPVVDGPSVHAVSSVGRCVTVDRESGARSGEFQGGHAWCCSLATANGTAYVGSIGGGVHAWDVASGLDHWQFRPDLAVSATPAVSGGTVYAGTVDDGRVYAVDAATGDRRWAVRTGDRIWGSVAVDGRTVYAGDGGGGVYALDAVSGGAHWRADVGSAVRTSPALTDDALYVGTTDGRVIALDRDVGRRLWEFKTAGAVVGAPVVGDGTLYVADESGRLYALAEATGQS